MSKRWILFLLLCIPVYVFYFTHLNKKQKAYADWKKQQEATAAAAQTQATAGSDGETVPLAGETTSESQTVTISGSYDNSAPRPTLETADRTTVRNEVMEVTFTHLGARPVSWRLLPTPYVINKGDDAQDGKLELIPQTQNPDTREWPLELAGQNLDVFNSEIFTATLTPADQGAQVLRFESTRPRNGITVAKEFVFSREGYAVQHLVRAVNGPETRIRLGGDSLGIGIGWHGGFMEPSEGDRIRGIQQMVVALGDDIKTKSLKRGSEILEYTSNVAWVGVEKKFFAALLVPDPANKAMVATGTVRDRNVTPEYYEKGITPPHSVTVLSERKTLGPSESAELRYTLYVGPLSHRLLSRLDPPMVDGGAKLSEAAFHWMPLGMGWIRPVCLVLLRIMNVVQGWVGNWGIAVIALTCIVKTALLPLTWWAIKSQARTMAEQGKIKPQLQKITAMYKDDMMKRNQAIQALYREHGISMLGPMRGCLPMLLQMPIFMGLYVLFDQAVELRGQEFLWIDDLAQPDRLIPFGFSLPIIGSAFNLLPILMATSQYFTMKSMKMSSGDEMQEQIQRQMTVMMPIGMGILLFQMPAGLMLYWVVSNLWSLVQGHVTKKLVAKQQAILEAQPSAPPPTNAPKKITASSRK